MNARRLLGLILLCVLTAPALAGSRGAVSRAGSRPASKSARPITRAAETPPPVSLSDPDGQEMALEELSVNAAVHGMLSLTELTLRFRNPHPRRMEGRFTCVLPAGAAVSRFAKEVNGRLMEGEVVERLRANQVYDAILHEMRDPALLEEDQGNRFSARVFPIEANASVRILVSYTRLLPLQDGVRNFGIPLRGLPTVGHLTVHALIAPLPGEEEPRSTEGTLSGPSGAKLHSVRTLDLDERDVTPERDLTVRWRVGARSPAVQSLRAGDFVLTAFRPPLALPVGGPPRGPWVFFVDTSASGAEGMAHRGEALHALLAALPPEEPVEVIAFDQEIEPLGTASARDWATRIGPALKQRGFLGGTDFSAALEAAAERARKKPLSRIVFVTDGVATLGKTSRGDLLAAAGKVANGATLQAVVLGAREDQDALQSIVEGRGRVVSIPFSESMAELASEAARRLQLPVGPTLSVSDPNAVWLYPATVSDAQAGTEILALEKVKPGQAPAVTLRNGKKTLLSSLATARSLPAGTFEPLLTREAYRAYLAYLAARESKETDPAVRAALATEQVRVSVERRVLISRTTLLVLESEADYQRFGLDRRALASILAVGPGGIERVDRAAQQIAAGRKEARQVTAPEARDKDIARKARTESRGRATVAPEPPALAERQKTARDSIVTLNDRVNGVEGGVEGGVAGGVMGDVVGGAAGATLPAEKAESPAESARTRADAPAPMAYAQAPPPASQPQVIADAMPRPAPAREQPVVAAPRRRAQPESTIAVSPGGPAPIVRGLPAWTTPAVPTRAEVDALWAQVKADPLRRDAYNPLSEALLASADWKRLRELALRWQPYDPENPHVYECLGEAALNLGRSAEAARAFGSLVEVAPGKPELLQRAGLLLFRAGARRLAETPLRRALELRPDRVNAYRHLALVLWQEGRLAEAARVLEDATRQSFPGWYGDAQRVVREELAYVYRDIARKQPERREELARRLREMGTNLDRTDALRVTLAWETDANDVDLHVVDPRGEECFYGHRTTAAGLELYEDITRGFGPEVVRTSGGVAGTYQVGVNYFSAGPMGVSRGILVVLRPGAKDAVQIIPFRLVAGGRDMRLLARVTVKETARVARVTR